VAGGANEDEHRKAAAGRFRIEDCNAPLDEATLLHKLDPSPAGIARQVDPLRQRIHRKRAVALELAEDSDIHVVNLMHIGIYIPIYYLDKGQMGHFSF
jgi:hypothetical protein